MLCGYFVFEGYHQNERQFYTTTPANALQERMLSNQEQLIDKRVYLRWLLQRLGCGRPGMIEIGTKYICEIIE